MSVRPRTVRGLWLPWRRIRARQAVVTDGSVVRSGREPRRGRTTAGVVAALVLALAVTLAACGAPPATTNPTGCQGGARTMSKLPDPFSSPLAHELKKLKDRIRQLELRSPYANSAFRPEEDGSMSVVNSLVVTEGLARSGNFDAGVSGWQLSPNGDAELNELTLRAGIVGTDALAEPLIPARLHDDGQGFNVTTAWQTVASVAATVPAGCTQALILNLATGATAWNSTAGNEFLYVRGQVSGYALGGWTLGSAAIGSTGTGVATDIRTGLLTGLTPGASVTFSAQVSSAFGTWAANSSNLVNLDAAVLWLR